MTVPPDIIVTVDATIVPINIFALGNTWTGQNTFTGTIAATGGAVVPTVVSPSANGVWISGANSPGLSVTSVDFAGTYYAQQWIQFTTAQGVSIAETGLGINATFSTGWAASSNAAQFKEAVGIWSVVNGGAGQVWNLSSDMVINSTYGQSPRQTNNNAFNFELDITNNGWDAFAGNTIGNIANIFISGDVGAFPVTAMVWIAPAGGSSSNYGCHYGLMFQNSYAFKDATIVDFGTNSAISYYDTGTHVYGINLSGTYSVSQIAGTGFNINPNGFIQTNLVNLGFSGVSAGSLLFSNATSGFITIAPPTGALGTPTLTLPAVTDTLAGKSVANGGTGRATFTLNGVLYGNGTTGLLATAQGAANTILVANAGAPSFSASPTIGTSVTTPTFFGTASGGSSTAAFQVASTLPGYAWDVSNQGADQKWWDVIGSGTQFVFRAVNDANSSATQWMVVNRGSGIAITSISMNAPVLIPAADNVNSLIISGVSKGVRFVTHSTGIAIEGVDNTGVATFQPLVIGGLNLQFQSSGSTVFDYGVTTGSVWTFASAVVGTSTIQATGFKVGANQVVGARVTGYTAMTGTPDKASAFATGSVTLAQLAGRVMQLQADLTTHGLIGA